MVGETRRVPGENLSERLSGRFNRRPRLGLSPAFYERFGLADPWLADAPVGGQDDPFGFTYVSGAPFYAMLRRLGQARRRLFERIERFSHGGLHLRAVARLWPGETPRAGLSFGLPVLGVTDLVLPQPPPPEVVAVPQADGAAASPARDRRPTPSVETPWLVTPWSPARVVRGQARPSEPTARLDRGGARAPRLEASASRPRAMERAGARLLAAPSDRTSVGRALREAVEERAVVRTSIIRRVARNVVEVEEAETPTARRRALRRAMRELGPVGRLHEAEITDSLPDDEVGSLGVALGRASRGAARSKGLRPVLRGSPLMHALEPEPIVVETAAEAAARMLESTRRTPAGRAQPVATRKVPPVRSGAAPATRDRAVRAPMNRAAAARPVARAADRGAEPDPSRLAASPVRPPSADRRPLSASPVSRTIAPRPAPSVRSPLAAVNAMTDRSETDTFAPAEAPPRARSASAHVAARLVASGLSRSPFPGADVAGAAESAPLRRAASATVRTRGDMFAPASVLARPSAVSDTTGSVVPVAGGTGAPLGTPRSAAAFPRRAGPVVVPAAAVSDAERRRPSAVVRRDSAARAAGRLSGTRAGSLLPRVGGETRAVDTGEATVAPLRQPVGTVPGLRARGAAPAPLIAAAERASLFQPEGENTVAPRSIVPHATVRAAVSVQRAERRQAATRRSDRVFVPAWQLLTAAVAVEPAQPTEAAPAPRARAAWAASPAALTLSEPGTGVRAAAPTAYVQHRLDAAQRPVTSRRSVLPAPIPHLVEHRATPLIAREVAPEPQPVRGARAVPVRPPVAGTRAPASEATVQAPPVRRPPHAAPSVAAMRRTERAPGVTWSAGAASAPVGFGGSDVPPSAGRALRPSPVSYARPAPTSVVLRPASLSATPEPAPAARPAARVPAARPAVTRPAPSTAARPAVTRPAPSTAARPAVTRPAPSTAVRPAQAQVVARVQFGRPLDWVSSRVRAELAVEPSVVAALVENARRVRPSPLAHARFTAPDSVWVVRGESASPVAQGARLAEYRVTGTRVSRVRGPESVLPTGFTPRAEESAVAPSPGSAAPRGRPLQWVGARTFQTPEGAFQGAVVARTLSAAWSGAPSYVTPGSPYEPVAGLRTPSGAFTGAGVFITPDGEYVGSAAHRTPASARSVVRLGTRVARLGDGRFVSARPVRQGMRSLAGPDDYVLPDRERASTPAPSAEGAAPRSWGRSRAGLPDTLGAIENGETAGVMPVWAQRANGEPLVRGSGGDFIAALAHASAPEDVVRVIIERGGALQQAALPQPVLQVIQAIRTEARVAEQDAGAPAQSGAGARTARGAPTRSTARVVRGFASVRSGGARTSSGVGADRVMKLAQKLQQLIHLAEVQRQRDAARAQVRMAEDSAAARADSKGASPTQAGGAKERQIDVEALFREALEFVTDQFEMRRMRRQEEGDGRDNWW